MLGTNPANGEVRDDPNLAEIVIYFDRPMAQGTCTGLSTTGDEWGDPDAAPAADYWSPDFRAYHIVRNNPETLLRTGKEITIRLNPQECTLFFYQGADGHRLGTYTFTFTIGDGDTELHAVPAENRRRDSRGRTTWESRRRSRHTRRCWSSRTTPAPCRTISQCTTAPPKRSASGSPTTPPSWACPGWYRSSRAR